MLQVQCHHCGTTHQVDPSHAGATVTCTACGNSFVVPAAPTAQAAPLATPAQGHAAPMARPAMHPAAQPAQHAASPVPPHLTQPGAATPSAPAPQIATSDSTSADSVEDEMDLADGPDWIRRLTTALFWLLLVVAVAAVCYAGFQYLPGLLDSSKTAKKKEPPPPPPPRKTTPWTDASKKNLVQRLNGVKVQVTRVEFDEVLAKDVSNTVQRGSAFLQVFVRVENTTDREIDYLSWYGNMFRFAGRKTVATLVDSDNRKYQMMTFEDVVAIKGHVPEATLKTRNKGRDKKYVEDVLIFDIPANVVPEQVDSFRLDLPAAAVKLNGRFRFQIPGSMINQAPGGPDLGSDPNGS